jgi:hypothetical protein
MVRLTEQTLSFSTASGSTNPPVRVSVSQTFATNARMLQLLGVFQQYKLVSVRAVIQPLVKDGTRPCVIYFLSTMDENQSPSDDLILAKGKYISNDKTTTHTIRASGRQNDFNYWFDAANYNAVGQRPSITLHFDNGAGSEAGYYHLTLLATVSFRLPQSLSLTAKFNALLAGKQAKE